jgi:hypothetical protein
MVKSPDAKALVKVAREALTGQVEATDLYSTFGTEGLLGLHDAPPAAAAAAPAAAAAAPAAAAVVAAGVAAVAAVAGGPAIGYKYMTPAELDAAWTITAADHASVMGAMADRSNTTKVGDPGHASSLVIKAEAGAFGLGPALKLARKVCSA